MSACARRARTIKTDVVNVSHTTTAPPLSGGAGVPL
jgi:hypothetical protein